jgi:hypothetical protein
MDKSNCANSVSICVAFLKFLFLQSEQSISHATIAEVTPPLPTPVRIATHLHSASKQKEQPAIPIEISIITIYVKLFGLYNFIT